jgi:hypothetical protein
MKTGYRINREKKERGRKDSYCRQESSILGRGRNDAFAYDRVSALLISLKSAAVVV